MIHKHGCLGNSSYLSESCLPNAGGCNINHLSSQVNGLCSDESREKRLTDSKIGSFPRRAAIEKEQVHPSHLR